MYSLGNELEKKASKIIKHYIEEGIIRESHSAWQGLIILVKKKNSSHRLCIDYKGLKDITVKDIYPMPRVDETLDALAGSKIFTKLNTLSDFHQINMHERDIEKTAFGCREGVFELVNAPATFSAP